MLAGIFFVLALLAGLGRGYLYQQDQPKREQAEQLKEAIEEGRPLGGRMVSREEQDARLSERRLRGFLITGCLVFLVLGVFFAVSSLGAGAAARNKGQ